MRCHNYTSFFTSLSSTKFPGLAEGLEEGGALDTISSPNVSVVVGMEIGGAGVVKDGGVVGGLEDVWHGKITSI